VLLADTVLDDENENSEPAEVDELVLAGADDEAGEQ